MKRACIGLLAVFLLAGCRHSSTAESPPETAGPGPSRAQPQVPPEPEHDIPPATAADEPGWVAGTWNQVLGTGGQTVQDTGDWLNRAYQAAREQGLTTAGNVKDWVTSDLQSMGDWEYRILMLDPADPAAVESRLNELGTRRWECFHVADSGEQWTVFLKRSKRSLLSKIPLRDLVNVLPMADGDGQQ